jgi:hypothetical protein
MREMMLGVLVVGEGLLEFRAGEAVANEFCEVAKVEALARGIWRAEKALHAFAEILGADEEGLGVFGVGLDEADGGERGESGEEVFGVGWGEVLAAVEIEHGRRILRREVKERRLGRVCSVEEVDS